MLDDLGKIKDEVENFSVADEHQLEEYRLKYLSRKGVFSQLFDSFKELPPDEKKKIGKNLNELKKFAEEKYNINLSKLSDKSDSGEEMDLSLPGRSFSVGREHILSKTLNDFVSIFREIGFKVAEGPEIEDSFHNFDALNTPDWHPSRDIQDTFYVENKFDKTKEYILRTHTSPIQIRTMLNNEPPIRIVAPGKAYRNEAVTPKNYFIFHQVEGLYVDKGVNMSHLKSVLDYFVKKYYGADTATRFRPSYFPFTEPSAEMDLKCFICKGKGCRTCKNTGWLELGGCGMVHPNVFRTVNYDPEVYTGYAFGLGIERIAMMKYGISDIRMFYQNDLRFIDQF